MYAGVYERLCAWQWPFYGYLMNGMIVLNEWTGLVSLPNEHKADLIVPASSGSILSSVNPFLVELLISLLDGMCYMMECFFL